MSEDEIIKLRIEFGQLQSAVHNLTKNVTSTNRKLEDFTSMLGQQNLLMERFTNMDTSIHKMEQRVYHRLDTIENQHSGDGCSALKQLGKAGDLYEEKFKVANHRLDNIENSQKWLVRTIVGFVVLAVLKIVFMGIEK